MKKETIEIFEECRKVTENPETIRRINELQNLMAETEIILQNGGLVLDCNKKVGKAGDIVYCKCKAVRGKRILRFSMEKLSFGVRLMENDPDSFFMIYSDDFYFC